jgi:UDP-N-acetylmuramyl pentapeptide synthase
MRNALESLAQLKGEGRAIAVLGDMGELGDAADEAHREAGRLVAELGIDFLFALGERGRGVAEGARSCGMDAGHVHIEAEHEEVGQMIAKMLGRHDWVLVKGSRAMRMERVIEALVAKENH